LPFTGAQNKVTKRYFCPKKERVERALFMHKGRDEASPGLSSEGAFLHNHSINDRLSWLAQKETTFPNHVVEMKHDFFCFPDDPVFASRLFWLGYWYHTTRRDDPGFFRVLRFSWPVSNGSLQFSITVCATYHMTKPQKPMVHLTQVYAG
jgi:hypothetical protein